MGSELTAVAQKRFCFRGQYRALYRKGGHEGSVCLCPGTVSRLQTPRKACSMRACCGGLWFIMERGTKGCEVMVTEAPRIVKPMKIVNELMLTTMLTVLCVMCSSDRVC